MTNIWDYFKNFFQEAEQSSGSNPLVHELIERSEKEKIAFENWKGSLTCRRIFDFLAAQHAMFQSNPDSIDRAVTFLRTPSSKGFAIHFSLTEYTRQDAIHFLDFLQEKVLTLNYRPQMSDTRTWSQNDWVQTVERHYLKPRQSWADGEKIEQQYGNITIELSLRNDRPHDLTFRATHYSDRLYADADDFHGLMQVVLS